MLDLDRLACELLEISYSSDPRRILGVPIQRTDSLAIPSALRRRFAQLHVHPKGISEDADEVRRYLKQIATSLQSEFVPYKQTQHPSALELTPLDRSILAVLITEGGWNKRSRARLVAVAASYSITAGGLTRILEALAESSRSGTGPLYAKRSSGNSFNRAWTTAPVKKTTFSIVDDFLDSAAKKFTPDLRDPTPVMTIKITVLFAMLTLLAFVLSLQVLLSADTETSQNANDIPIENSYFPNQSSNTNTDTPLYFVFTNYPTFLDKSVRDESFPASDRAVDIPKKLVDLASSIQTDLLRSDKSDVHWFTAWEEIVHDISLGTPHIDYVLANLIEDRMVDVILQAQRKQEVATSLIESLKMKPIRIGFPMRVYQTAWSAKILTKLSCDQRLSPTSRSAARRLQWFSTGSCDALAVYEESLDDIAEQLIAITEFDDRVFALWESWLNAVEHLTYAQSRNTRFSRAISALLNANIDLLRESNTRKVLGRLVLDMDWVSEITARDTCLGFYQASEMPSVKIWLLGSLLLQNNATSWFSTKHLLTPDATTSERRAKAKLLQQDWPSEAAPSATVWNLFIPQGYSQDLSDSWDSVHRNLLQYKDFQPLQIVQNRLLNEAAVQIWKGRPDLAANTLSKVDTIAEQFVQREINGSYPNDGQWSNLYLQAGSDFGEKIDHIEALLFNDEYRDLGIQDAQTLATIALTHQIAKIRTKAIEVIVQKFTHSRNVAVALVDKLYRAKSRRDVAKLVANMTEAILPDQRDTRWDAQAKRALVQHAYTTDFLKEEQLDIVSTELSRSLIAELLFIEPSMIPPSNEINATTALQMLVDTWRLQLPPTYALRSDMYFKASGVMQQYFQLQLEYLRFIQADELRLRGVDPTSVLAKTEIDFDLQATDIASQLLKAERSISNHWSLVFSALDVEYVRQRERAK